MHSAGKSSIEEQLAQYRLRKKKEETHKSVKKRFWELIWSAMSVMRNSSTASASESSSSADEQQPKEHSDAKVNIVAFNLSVYLSFYVSISLYISIHLFIFISVHIFIFIFISTNIYICIYIYIYL